MWQKCIDFTTQDLSFRMFIMLSTLTNVYASD